MIGYCQNCKHRHTVMEGTSSDGGGWMRCGHRGCDCGWSVSVVPTAMRNLPHRPDYWLRTKKCDDRSLRAVILHRALDAHHFPHCHSDYDDLDLGRRVLRAELAEALAEGARRGFPTDLEALSKIQNDETVQLHRDGKDLPPIGRAFCGPKKLCNTCERIVAGGNIWWPPS